MNKVLLAVLSGLFLSTSIAAHAEPTLVLCTNNKTGVIVARQSCIKNEKRLKSLSVENGKDGTNGTNGASGKDGADGSLKIYGDGSSGALNITADTDWLTTPPPSGINYFTDVTVAAGAKLIVPTGFVFRCTGNVVVNGSLIVKQPDLGWIGNWESGLSAPTAGIGFVAASGLVKVTDLGLARGGSGGVGLGNVGAAANLRPGLIQAGGATAGFSPSAGGGALFILAKGSISIGTSGSISANGADGRMGSGGGGGGVLVLASPTSITNSGTLSAKGGKGAEAGDTLILPPAHLCGSGGGGGGGIVHFISPVVQPGTSNVSGGKGGYSGQPDVIINLASTGCTSSGGGASYGNGGIGGDVVLGGTGPYSYTLRASGGSDGAQGITINTPVDPTFSF